MALQASSNIVLAAIAAGVITVGGIAYTVTLTPTTPTPPVTAPVSTATPQLPKSFMTSAWPLNQPATQYPDETRSLPYNAGDGQFVVHGNISDTFHAQFGANHIVFDTSMRITTVDTRQTPGIFAPVTITTNWGSDDASSVPVVGCKIEGGGNSPATSDRHCLIYDVATSIDHELFATSVSGGLYSAAAYRRWDTTKAQQGTPGQNSADAAGLPILPLLLRWTEANSGAVRHALRATINLSRDNGNGGVFVAPASHAAGNNWGSPVYMGQRFYLRKDFPTTGLAPIAVTIVNCLKSYGIVIADNGNSGLITSDNDSRWNGDMLNGLSASMTLNDFMPVNSGAILDSEGVVAQ